MFIWFTNIQNKTPATQPLCTNLTLSPFRPANIYKIFRYDCASGNTSFKQSALLNKPRSYDPMEADILVGIRWNINDVLYCLFTLGYIIYTRLYMVAAVDSCPQDITNLLRSESFTPYNLHIPFSLGEGGLFKQNTIYYIIIQQ